MHDLDTLAREAHAIAKANGFHSTLTTFDHTKPVLSWLMLIVTEVAEAAEAVRSGDEKNFGEELADICIRVFDTAEALGVSLEQEIVDKMDKNRSRSYRHGGKRA